MSLLALKRDIDVVITLYESIQRPVSRRKAKIERLRIRHDELANVDKEDWIGDLVAEAGAIEACLDTSEAEVERERRERERKPRRRRPG